MGSIRTWEGDENLKKRILGWFSRLGERGVANYLRVLVDRGVLTTENEHAWKEVRNAVMHGKLVSPWTTKKGDEQLLALADLVHRLTHELIRAGINMNQDLPM